jgi:hypothetical protein
LIILAVLVIVAQDATTFSSHGGHSGSAASHHFKLSSHGEEANPDTLAGFAERDRRMTALNEGSGTHMQYWSHVALYIF